MIRGRDVADVVRALAEQPVETILAVGVVAIGLTLAAQVTKIISVICQTYIDRLRIMSKVKKSKEELSDKVQSRRKRAGRGRRRQ